MPVRPFLNYNFKGGTYRRMSPIMTAIWQANNSNAWTIPLGGGVGIIFHFGKLPLNAQIGAYYNAERPDFGADWQLRTQIQFMFPK